MDEQQRIQAKAALFMELLDALPRVALGDEPADQGKADRIGAEWDRLNAERDGEQ